MAIQTGDTIRADDFINKDERDSTTPANDEGKVVKLESDGMLSSDFLNTANWIKTTYNLADSPVTWTKPEKLKGIRVQLWAGGGSGFAHYNVGTNGSGGGGGMYIERYLLASELGTTETITIGAGGAAKTVIGNGNNGSNSTFGSLLTAIGGQGGFLNVGGNGGSSSYENGAGGGNQTGGQRGIYSGGGGGAISSSHQGLNGGNSIYGGAGGAGSGSPSGGGGVSIFGGNGGGPSTDGVVPGGGGGGGRTDVEPYKSGAGGAGRCIVTEYYN